MQWMYLTRHWNKIFVKVGLYLFFKIILNPWSDPGTFSVPDESFDPDRRSLRYDSFHRMQITFSFPGSYPEGCFRHGYHQKKENCKKYGKNIEIKMAS